MEGVILINRPLNQVPDRGEFVELSKDILLNRIDALII